jgi:hypothetical protein
MEDISLNVRHYHQPIHFPERNIIMVFKFKAGFARSLKQNLRWFQLLLLTVVLGLQGCVPNTGTANIITGLTFKNDAAGTGLSQLPNQFCDSTDQDLKAQCTPELLASLQYAPLDQSMLIWLEGTGTCVASVDFGDGTPPEVTESFHTWPWPVLHTYTGWPGKKLIKVKAQNGCLGDLTTLVTVGRSPDNRQDYRLAFVPTNMVCNIDPNMPILRKGSGVRITTDGGKIIYGSISFDASGDLSSTSTPAGFAFTGFRVFSLVYKVGASQFIQGEAGEVVFKAAETAPLEICVNDDPSYLFDNAGGMLITITVNEASAE